MNAILFGEYFEEVNKHIKWQNITLKAKIAIALFVFISLSSCVSLQMRAGAAPDIPALETLTVGVSTAPQVEARMGKPFGTGRSLLPFQGTVGDIWTYYYEEGTVSIGGSDDRRTFLFIYFNEGIYDGYMWFSSLPDQQTPVM